MKMSNYCKAYTADRFREFEGWTEAAQTDASVLYLHDSFIVTDGVCLDEGVVFDTVTPEWRRFCTERLEFRVPEDLRPTQEGGDEPTSAA